MRICKICGKDITKNVKKSQYDRLLTCGSRNCISEYMRLTYLNRISKVVAPKKCCECRIKFFGKINNEQPTEYNGKLYCSSCLERIL